MKTNNFLGYRNGKAFSTFFCTLIIFLINFSLTAQDLIINTADILANVTNGSTSAVITKS
jgi:hypothetical protein